MTGAVCPQGADTVIPYEQLTITDGVALLHEMPAKRGKNIHRRASDKVIGDCLASAGLRISPAEIGIASSIGKTELLVQRLPRVVICSTGDELVPITNVPLSHQIRRSNVYALQAMMHAQGIECELMHLADNHHTLTIALEQAIKSNDVVLLSGGVSKGKFDLIPDVLQSIGANCLFHRIAQKPGKPMWFGRSAHCIVFAFPGNPLSTMACASRYLLPWLKREMGLPVGTLSVAASDVTSHTSLTLFDPVMLNATEQGSTASIIKHQGSGDFSALAGAHGFIEIPSELDSKKTGSRFRFYPLS
jgi:molybdopterin molybdotransferase